MTSENETVASVADCIRHLADNLQNGVILNIAQCNFTADRIESAWRREKAELERKVADALTTGAFVAETSARKPKRNCDRFASYKEAVNAWNAMAESRRTRCGQLM